MICLECSNEVSEGDALNGYCPRCVDRFIRDEEGIRETPLGEFYEDMDQGVSDSFNPVNGEMD